MNNYMLLYLICVIIGCYSQVLLKKAANVNYENKLKEYLNKFVIIGYGLFSLNAGLNIIAMKGTPLKVAPILESLSYFIIMVFGSYFLNEKITKRKVMGNLIIFAGIIVFFLF